MADANPLQESDPAVEESPKDRGTLKTGPSLLDLPLELRLMIYNLIDDPLDIHVFRGWIHDTGRMLSIRKDPTKKNLVHPACLKNLSRVCKGLHWELQHAVQGGQSFHDYVLANYMLYFHGQHVFRHMVKNPEYKLD